ncbi:hypothetical protein QA584_02325 [Anaerocolumna sp. AGMB13025]|uniref:HAAS signaling domain-containing protein n=1 Tax=Anaerocolumna sp. AGMB13025 TaxID=3039116 RepID=UPI00241EB1D8|nr:DUF1700 domain-containing protein [Anaerocolumna sp. AGMB13025]WFR57924.1 hypothetical protein QA584_02325 [Anaerocolumna sp. AGMB13025]
MTKNEFIDGLRVALKGEIPDTEVTSNILFYEDYIKSKSSTNQEEEVIFQLGDPRLIAKTIIETYQISHGPLYGSAKQEGTYQDTQNGGSTSYKEYQNNYEDGAGDFNRKFRINPGTSLTWYQKLIFTMVAILVIVLFFIIGGILLRLFFTVGLPILVIYLGYRLIINNYRR